MASGDMFSVSTENSKVLPLRGWENGQLIGIIFGLIGGFQPRNNGIFHA